MNLSRDQPFCQGICANRSHVERWCPKHPAQARLTVPLDVLQSNWPLTGNRCPKRLAVPFSWTLDGFI